MSILGREAKVEAVIMNILAPSARKNTKTAGGGAPCKNLILEGALEQFSGTQGAKN